MYLSHKGSVPKQAHVGVPEGLHEEEHGRRGFQGPASHLYRTHPPTGWIRIEGPLRPRAFACAALPTPDHRTAEGTPMEILRSPDVSVFVSRRAATMPFFVRNADGDEVYFVHAGTGRLESDYGVLPYEPGDYLVIPKGTTYRVHIEGTAALFLIVETPQPVMLPDRGLLGHHA
ncbi:MAG: cupin domain-containing protein, partial [bacterium]